MTACADVRALCPEAALGLLSGTERAVVLDHVDQCESCRELMHELSSVSDELALLAPNAEPPAGFEQRVLGRLGATRPRRRWPIALGAVAAAVMAVVAFALWRADDGSSPSVHQVAMHTASGRVVGDAYIHGGDPTWVFVAVPGWQDGSSTEYRLRVTFADGAATEVAGSGSWATTLPVDAARVTELSLVDGDGKVWCSATV